MTLADSEDIVLVTGTFNIVHAGHVSLLEFASRYGKVVVGINSDDFLVNKYGDLAVPALNRSYVLRSLKFVNKVIVFKEDEPSSLIRKIKPAYYIKGPDYKSVNLPEQKAIESTGTRLIIQPTQKEFDSSELIKSVPKSAFKKFDKWT